MRSVTDKQEQFFGFDTCPGSWQLAERRLITTLRKELGLAKPEWGTKRACDKCSARFYDLNRSPALCPQCGTQQANKPSTKTAAAKAPPPKALDREPKAFDEEAPAPDEVGDDDVDDVDVEVDDDDDGDDTADGDGELIEDTSNLIDDADDVAEGLINVEDGDAVKE